LATGQGNRTLADAIREQIELYQSGSPSRDNGQRPKVNSAVILFPWAAYLRNVIRGVMAIEGTDEDFLPR
jgi:hypothetical protein